MTRCRKAPLRNLTSEEKSDLETISRVLSVSVEAVIRAKIVRAVAAGLTYQKAAHSAGRKSGDAVSALVSRFNQERLDALVPRRSRNSGFQSEYGPNEKARILREFKREPDPGWDKHLVTDDLAAYVAQS